MRARFDLPSLPPHPSELAAKKERRGDGQGGVKEGGRIATAIKKQEKDG